MPSGKWRPFCIGLNVVTIWQQSSTLSNDTFPKRQNKPTDLISTFIQVMIYEFSLTDYALSYQGSHNEYIESHRDYIRSHHDYGSRGDYLVVPVTTFAGDYPDSYWLHLGDYPKPSQND